MERADGASFFDSTPAARLIKHAFAESAGCLPASRKLARQAAGVAR